MREFVDGIGELYGKASGGEIGYSRGFVINRWERCPYLYISSKKVAPRVG